jgi:hypothetical protein
MITVKPNLLDPADCNKILKRSIWFSKVSGFLGKKNNGIKRTYIQPFIKDILKKIESNFPEGTYSAELVTYNAGITNPEHVDFKGDFPSGFLTTRTVEWKYTGIILLNNNYEGGVLYFPKHRKAFGKESLGTLITFPAGVQNYDYTHGVTTITSGTRYTLVLRFI